ncbi:MAG: hypothetical protein AAGK22_19865 [Acidobacteriota bacterium]
MSQRIRRYRGLVPARPVRAVWLCALLVTLGCSGAAPPTSAPIDEMSEEAEFPEEPVLRGEIVEEPGPPREPVLLRWSTASEFENFGFHIYRGPTVEGPFARLTEESIPGAGTSSEPRHYSFEDASAEAGESYYYFVELVSNSGKTRRLTPPTLFQN